MLNGRYTAINSGSGSVCPLVGHVWLHQHNKNECVAGLSAMNDYMYYKSLAPIIKDRYLGKLLAMGLKEKDNPYSATAAGNDTRGCGAVQIVFVESHRK